MAQPGATAFSATARSQAKSLSIKTAEAKGVSALSAASLKSEIWRSVTGPVSVSANIARIDSRWSIASIAKAPEGRARRLKGAGVRPREFSACTIASVDRYGDAVDQLGRRRGKEDGGAGELLWLRPFAARNPCDNLSIEYR